MSDTEAKARYHQSLLQNSYEGVPGLDCSGCPGDCCVSPTMTAPEFVLMMREALQILGAQTLQQLLTMPAREHFQYSYNAFCRFQAEHGLCINYTGRALACRLHGHEALRAFASPEMEFCERHPAGYDTLQPEEAQKLVDQVQTVLQDAALIYQEPYYLISLNLECWIDFFYHPEWAQNRPTLHHTRRYLDDLLTQMPSVTPTHHTTLGGKLNLIDKLHQAIQENNGMVVQELLQSLQFDFPSCASYYVEEARHMEQIFLSSLET